MVAPRTQVAVPALEAHGLAKRFGDALVLDHVDFALAAGEIHALLGENGAGKSTLMNILTGLYSPEAGHVRVGGVAVAIRSPGEALALGIGMVHQHFRLAAAFTGRENVRLATGNLPALRGRGRTDAALDHALARTGLEVPLDEPVGDLSVADQQRIEILKALSLGARILILDEPTAVLTDQEGDRLLAMVRRLASSGTSVVLITHKLREVLAASDRVSVMRAGRMVLAARGVDEVSAEILAEAMIGQAAPATLRSPSPPGAVLLELAGVSVLRRGAAAVRDVHLSLRSGQIMGIAGVGGNGQQELAEAIVGLRRLETGQVRLAGADMTGRSVDQRRGAGMRYVPSDRSTQALAPDASVNDNLAAAAVSRGRLGRRMVLPRRISAHARGRIEAFSIAGVTARGTRPVRLLSGGNAQKVVLARELDAEARLIVVHSPTRGLDVAACRYVHDQLIEAAKNGAAVLLISEDLEEILALSDDIRAMSRGQLSTPTSERPSRREIGQMMLGHA
ncbi:MAG: ABC transporter ATP-binding protein [Pseudomonadota bacterium]